MQPEPARPSLPYSTVEQSIPEPPWRANARARAQPRLPITRDAIIEAALHVLDHAGLDGLTMHRVAQELGTGAASLYWHVRNKDVARQIRVGAHRHRDSARISLGRLPSGPALARFSEWLFALVTPVGIPDRQIAYLADLLNLYVGAYAFEESLGLASPTGEDLPLEQIVSMLRNYLLSLPADRFPHLHRAIGDLFAGDRDNRFEFGLDLILRGIATYSSPIAARDDTQKRRRSRAQSSLTQPTIPRG